MTNLSEKISVLLVEDDFDFAFLVEKTISKEPYLDFIAHAKGNEEALALCKEFNPDIVLMDLNLTNGDLDGIELARQIRLLINAKILLLSSFEQSEIVIKASKRALASGYVFKSQCQTLPDTILKTATGPTPQSEFIKELVLTDLSLAERSVLSMLLGEKKDIHSSIKTVANQKTSIFKKLGFKSTREILHVFRDW